MIKNVIFVKGSLYSKNKLYINTRRLININGCDDITYLYLSNFLDLQMLKVNSKKVINKSVELISTLPILLNFTMNCAPNI